MTRDLTKTYTNGEITVVWRPLLCQHVALCLGGLPDVFNPSVHPWINPECASSQAIIDQIEKCPSGALSYYYNEKSDK